MPTGAPGGRSGTGLFATVGRRGRLAGRGDRRRGGRQWTVDRRSAPPTTAVLVRRRSDMADTADALRAAGLPVEVVGLGGLLDEPEVADLVATLRVLVDPTAGPAAMRLLTGARWQLGAADLEALARRARELAGPGGRRGRAATDADSTVDEPAATVGTAAVRSAVAAALPVEDIDTWSLVDAAADLGPATAYSPEGHRRLARFAAHLAPAAGSAAASHCRIWSPTWNGRAGWTSRCTGSPATPGARTWTRSPTSVAEVAATGAGPTELLELLGRRRRTGGRPELRARCPSVRSGPGADRARGQGTGVGDRRRAAPDRRGLPDHPGQHLAGRCRPSCLRRSGATGMTCRS